MSKEPIEPRKDYPSEDFSSKGYCFNLAVTVLLIAAFIIYLSIAYIPNRSKGADARIIEDRYRTLEENKLEQAELMNQYEWVDKDSGLVRIPVERSMELTIKELNNNA